MLVIFLLFRIELVKSIDDFAAVPLAAFLALLELAGGTHNGNVELSVTSTNMIPVDEVYVSELTAVQLAILDGKGLGTTEEYGTKMSVGIHGSEVAGLIHLAAELCMDRSGMTILMLYLEIGNELTHDVKKVVLKELKIE